MNIEAEKVQAKAVKMLARFTVKQLCEQWEHTNTLEITVDLALVRGWLQDEFERRDADKFDTWLDTDDLEAMDHPATFFLTK